jgi:hypothetical protein
MKNIFLVLLALLLLVGTTSAAINSSYSPYFDLPTDEVHYNQSYTKDETNYTPWEFYILAGLISLGMFLLTVRPRTTYVELEVDAIISFISLAPIAFCVWASFNGVDRITGYGVTGLIESQSANGAINIHEYVLMVNHNLYVFPIEGALMALFFLVTIGNFLRILAQYKLFKIKSDEDEQKAKSEQTLGYLKQTNPEEKKNI